MIRYQLTTLRNNTRYLLLIFSFFSGLMAVIILVNCFIGDDDLSELILAFLICSAISAGLFYWYKHYKFDLMVKFDNRNIYIDNIEHNLKNVLEIEKPTIQFGNTTNNWIIYYQENRIRKSVKINVTFRHSELKKFKKFVKSANPKVRIHGFMSKFN